MHNGRAGNSRRHLKLAHKRAAVSDIQAALDKLTLHRNMTQVSPIIQQTRELDLLASSPKVVQKPLTVPAKPSKRVFRRVPASSMSATSYYLPSISKTQSKNVDAKWKCAQQIRNERLESASRSVTTDATNVSDDDYITTDGSDLTDDDDEFTCTNDGMTEPAFSEDALRAGSTPSNLTLRSDYDDEKANYDELTVNTKEVSLPLFRKSPFRQLNTTIRFRYPSDDAPTLIPPSTLPKLHWKNTSVTPKVIRRVLRNSKFELVENGKSWIGYWGKHLKAGNYAKLKSMQKVNHFPGCFTIGRKDRLWRTLSTQIARFGHGEYGFIPTTYILPKDRKLLKDNFGHETFIVKPAASARGIGIKIVSKMESVPQRRQIIVQKYIKNPLLINGLKWDLRIYVFVSSFCPLIAYISDDGLVRFATDQYTMNSKKRFVHLTNYSVNKKSSKFQASDDVNDTSGHKWSLKTLWPELEKLGFNKDRVWGDIKDVVLKTLVASEQNIVTQLHKNCAKQRNCFELYGFDLMLDRKGKVILIEVNVSPSLHSNSKLDETIKGKLIADVFNTTGFTPYKVVNAPPLSSHDRQLFARWLCSSKAPSRMTMLNNLSDYHKHLILKCEYERQRKGDLERLIPAPGVWEKYKRFFHTARIDNVILAAFEDEYGDNSKRRRLQAERIAVNLPK